MKNVPKLFVWLFSLTLLIIATLYIVLNIDNVTLFSIIGAYLLNLINSTSAVLAFNFGIKKSNKTFMVLVMGGMLVRLFFMLFAIIASIKFLNINRDAFILVFFIFYFILLFAEIFYFNKSIKDRLNRNPD